MPEKCANNGEQSDCENLATEEYHSCPYQEEVNDNCNKNCRCCSECIRECCEDI